MINKITMLILLAILSSCAANVPDRPRHQVPTDEGILMVSNS